MHLVYALQLNSSREWKREREREREREKKKKSNKYKSIEQIQ